MTTSTTRSLCITALLATVLAASAQGVMVHDASTGDLLPLGMSHITVGIEDQVALVSSAQRFTNGTADSLVVKYAYPLPATGSATRLRWMLPDSLWRTASMVAQPQDTTLPGTGGGAGMDAQLQDYLGDSPLYFTITEPVPPGGWITVELSYVELLPYANARVQLISESDYAQVLNAALPEMTLDISVRSQRAILGVDIAGTGVWSPSADLSYVTADSAYLHVADVNVPASSGFSFGYDLDPDAYGLTCLSNYLPDSLVKCDQMANGFFLLLIEPEPSSDVVAKDFVIVIDHSGSMSGTKMEEAKDAATFMVEHLNAGDEFNVIAFDDDNIRWNTDLQPFNATNMLSALNWIAGVNAEGSTNINGAVSEGISDFTTSTPGHARSLVFLTDGQDNTTSTATILSTAQQLRQSIAPDLQLFTFGIGEGFNEQLLNQLAVQNNGISQFLETANFSQVMSDFYTQIQNPVLLDPTATFDHPDVQNLYPQPLLGLFVGQQMALVGRYSVAGPTNLHLDGFASGSPVSFDFTFDLTDTFNEDKLFIPKIWAQKAVDALVNEYYSYADGSDEAEMIRDSIVSFSMCYGIGSPFTSFTDVGGGGVTIGMEEEQDNGANNGVAVFPEPSLSEEDVVFDLSALVRNGPVFIRIYDALGQLLYEQDITAFCGGTWTWNGLNAAGRPTKGALVYRIDDGLGMRTGRMTRL
jgi:Ca-activated chloride channel family protein